MFNKILIANRGEIACRVIKTARKMGIESVAIYSTPDRNSPAVKMANEAFWVGEAPAKDSYLHIEAIINIAKKSGAQAIHPGYGFLSENPEFARACGEAGIVFIGPSIKAMEAMASKQFAKQLLENTKVPLTPGYHGQEQSDEHLLKQARAIGFPLLLKAASGGGGKGMRAVHKEEDFLHALNSARREAKASFGDDTLIIEKLLLNPRHVEIQIMADNAGNVVHLFERDCSIQRRHQKIIEEAPAPNLSSTLRQNLAKAACEVALAIDYRGAGTIEFLVHEEQFYFMEMNTRLQVEHPVTEMITGLDLVAWQLRIAAGESLPLQQEAIKQKGHALECRIYAEDPYQNFMPSIGHIDFLKEPVGEGVRVDSGVVQGSAISMYYDPMIAKLITWGETRDKALYRMQQALKHYAIDGVKTNIPFLEAICSHDAFAKTRLSTDFLQQETIALPQMDTALSLILVASYDYLKRQEQQDPLQSHTWGWQMHLKSHWYWHYLIDQQRFKVGITPHDAQTLTIQIPERDALTIKTWLENGKLTIDDGQQQRAAWIIENQKQRRCHFEGKSITLTHFDWDTVMPSTSPKGQLTAPMPATIVAILKNIGDKVEEGERLIVLEAMKMEHTIHAPRTGVLTRLYYEVGAQVQEGAELLALED